MSERDPVRALERVLKAAREYAAFVPVKEAKATAPARERLQRAIADYDELFDTPDHFEGHIGANIARDSGASSGGETP